MAKFQFLPAETKFYEWFEKATGNLLEAAEALEDLLDHYEQVESKVARITELEHRGDFIVHEVMHLLMHTLIIPLDGEDVERLISARQRNDERVHQQMHDLMHDKIAAVLQLGDPGDFAFDLLVVVKRSSNSSAASSKLPVAFSNHS